MWKNRMIRYADIQDFTVLKEHDKHISESELGNIIPAKRVFVMYQGNTFMGWLRYGLFWDNTPFINMLYILDGYRGNGRELVLFWEKEMAKERDIGKF